MPATERILAEQQFHDRQAADRAASFRSGRADLLFADDDYLDHETWIRTAFAKLGELRGKRALDYGCGHGMAAVVLARAGAEVIAFDLSPNYVAEAQARARVNGVRVECMVANAEELPFPDESFDVVWGNAILHHLDLTRAGSELFRVMKPGAVAVFCEPWGGNPLLALARRWLPYPAKSRTRDERPLKHRDLAPLNSIFPDMKIEGAQFLGMIRRLRRGSLQGPGPIDRLDTRLLRWFPPLANWCRYSVITLKKPAS